MSFHFGDWLSALFGFAQKRQEALDAHMSTSDANSAALLQQASDALAMHVMQHPEAPVPPGNAQG